MDSANAYAVMNILSTLWTFGVVACTELMTIKDTWEHAIQDGAKACKKVMNTAKRVVVIVASAIVFRENLERNAMIGSAVAITGVLLYSLAEEAGKKKAK